MVNETTLTNWFLVTFDDVNDEHNQVLWGIVFDDRSFRWTTGSWCCTSQILESTDDGVFITKNSRYLTKGPGQTISLPVKSLIELREGVAPTEWQSQAT